MSNSLGSAASRLQLMSFIDAQCLGTGFEEAILRAYDEGQTAPKISECRSYQDQPNRATIFATICGEEVEMAVIPSDRVAKALDYIQGRTHEDAQEYLNIYSV